MACNGSSPGSPSSATTTGAPPDRPTPTAASYLGRASLATRRGATLSLDVATAGLGIMATTCPTCGSIKVYVDGELWEKVSLRSSETHNRGVVFWSDNGEEGFPRRRQ